MLVKYYGGSMALLSLLSKVLKSIVDELKKESSQHNHEHKPHRCCCLNDLVLCYKNNFEHHISNNNECGCCESSESCNSCCSDECCDDGCCSDSCEEDCNGCCK